jgi:hypothetical protein
MRHIREFGIAEYGIGGIRRRTCGYVQEQLRAHAVIEGGHESK